MKTEGTIITVAMKYITMQVYEFYFDNDGNKVKFNHLIVNASEWSLLSSTFTNWFNNCFVYEFPEKQELLDSMFIGLLGEVYNTENPILVVRANDECHIIKKSLTQHEIEVIRDITNDDYSSRSWDVEFQ